MQCSKCGREYPEGAKYCGYCRNLLAGQKEQVSIMPEPQDKKIEIKKEGDTGVDRSQTNVDSHNVSQDSSVKVDDHHVTQTADDHSVSQQDDHSTKIDASSRTIDNSVKTVHDNSHHTTTVGGDFYHVEQKEITCPICRNVVSKNTTFQCARCNNYVCLMHKDKVNISFCTECARLLADEIVGIRTTVCKKCGDEVNIEMTIECQRCSKRICKHHRDSKWQVCPDCAKVMDAEEKRKKKEKISAKLRVVGIAIVILVVLSGLIYFISNNIKLPSGIEEVKKNPPVEKEVKNVQEKKAEGEKVAKTEEQSTATQEKAEAKTGKKKNKKPEGNKKSLPQNPPKLQTPEQKTESAPISLPKVIVGFENLGKEISDFRVEVWTDKTEYHIGEKDMKFHFRSERDCYLTLIDVGTSGNVIVIFPNLFHQNNFIKAGIEYVIPNEDDGFKIEVGGPPGIEKIFVIASISRIEINNMNYSKEFYRGIKKEDKIATRDLQIYKDNISQDDKRAVYGVEIQIK